VEPEFFGNQSIDAPMGNQYNRSGGLGMVNQLLGHAPGSLARLT
jgi:hypothetical protein